MVALIQEEQAVQKLVVREALTVNSVRLSLEEDQEALEVLMVDTPIHLDRGMLQTFFILH